MTVYYSVLEAKICVSMLDGHGIFAFAPTEVAGNASHLMTAIGGIPVMVVDTDYDAAVALLADVKAPEPPSAKPRKSRPKALFDGIVALLVLLFTGVPPAPAPPATSDADDQPEKV